MITGAKHSRAGRRLAAALAVTLACACMGEKSKSGNGSGSGPWGSSAQGSNGKQGSDEHEAGGPAASPADLAGGLGMLGKIGEGLREPGPYEAPRRSKDYVEGKPHWWVMSLSGALVEREGYSLTGGSGSELEAVRERLAAAASDAAVAGVLLRVAGLEVSMPDAMELRAALHALRGAGKRVVCHSLGTSNVEYLVLAACDQVALAPLGEVAITGPAALPVHLRPLLQRFGVVADFVHVGAYKGAAEPFTHDAPSPQSREVLAQILDGRYQTMVEVISKDRRLPAAKVQELIDVGVHPSEQALAAGLVDAVESFEAARARLVQAPWRVVAADDDERVESPLEAMAELMRFVGAQPSQRPSHPRVALVYALGDIIDGKGEGLLGAREQIAAGTLVPALRVLAADDSVKAVVLRVDSGGGSAQASELIWAEVQALREKKPVIVSMSDVAASGGYYISCAATKIFAEPDTLTGSIGVVGGKLAFGRALEQLGVRTFPMGRGKRATMAASLDAWSAEERALVLQLMEQVYETFLKRVAAGRGKSRDQVHAVAQGRVWTGAKAKELGLIDELGGLEQALAAARQLAEVPASAELEVYPPEPTLRDLMVSFGQVSAGHLGLYGPAHGAAISALELTDPAIAAGARRLLAQLARFRTSKVQAVAWLPLLR